MHTDGLKNIKNSYLEELTFLSANLPLVLPFLICGIPFLLQ